MATFRQRNGRWQAIIRRPTLKATRTFDRKVDAQSWARAKERDADLGHMPGRMAGTIAALVDRYEKEMWKDKRWGTSKANELVTIKRDLGPLALEMVTSSRLLTYLRGLDIGPATAGTRLSYLKEVLRVAKDIWGLAVPLEAVGEAIVAGRRHKLVGRSQVRDRRPTAEEIAAILDFTKDREGSVDIRAVVEVLSVMPLRLGELLRIGWDDAVPDRRSVILRGRKHPDIREKEKAQEVPLVTFRGVDTYALVFDRPRYMDAPFPYKPNSVSMAFIMACKDLAIKDLHLHDLRAHAISVLLEAGVPIPQVALMSGHRNWKILQRNYSRIDPASVHETIARAEAAGIPAPPPPGKDDAGPA